jgi:hypothetical protein
MRGGIGDSRRGAGVGARAEARGLGLARRRGVWDSRGGAGFGTRAEARGLGLARRRGVGGSRKGAEAQRKAGEEDKDTHR